MFVAGAVCPHPPMLVPQIAAGATDLDALRAASLLAVGRILDVHPDRVVLVGGGPEQATFGHGAVADFSAYGVDLHITLGQAGQQSSQVPLPLSLCVGAWLLAEVGYAADVTAIAVPDGCSSAQANALGQSLMGSHESVAILALGDGSARRTPAAPGYVDARAVEFDRRVSTALAKADSEALLAIDEALAAQLMCAGRPSWQVLAGAAAGAVTHAELLYDDAPLGVGYFVTTWST